MKNTTKENKLLILAIIMIFVISAIWGIKNQSLKAQLAEAQQPSKIELQKEKLETLETEWREYEEKKNYCINTIKVMDEYKSEIEPQIQELRNEILGL